MQNEMAGKWQQLKGEVRSKWGKLTDDDIERIGGNKDKLIGALQERYGYVWDEARQMVDRYLDENGDLKTRAAEALRTVASKDNIQKLGNEVAEFVRTSSAAIFIDRAGYWVLARPARGKISADGAGGCSESPQGQRHIPGSRYHRRC